MTEQILIGIDAGTSLIKSVAFDSSGRQLAICSRPNEYKTLAGGGVEQDMRLTWQLTAETLRELSTSITDLSQKLVSIAVTGQGDGTWLVDQAGEPVHDAWLWLDSRASEQAAQIERLPAYERIAQRTGTGVNVCQMRTQLRWIQQHAPQLLDAARTSYHCKDYLYHQLTGVAATDPSEAVFTFGDFRTRQYSAEVIKELGFADHAALFPPIVDGTATAHPLSRKASQQTGLPEGTAVSLGYVDVICTALGGGLLACGISPGMTILGTTGMHMRYAPSATEVVLNREKTGYTMAFPGGGYAQMQSNMAATLNIDWMLDLAREVLSSHGLHKDRDELLKDLDRRVLQARPGAALYHPYISTAGERGPFVDPHARAGFSGLDSGCGYYDLLRSVYEGLAFAARECYSSMGELPEEIRVSGGAAKSSSMLQILSSVLARPVRVVDNAEAGACGAVMMAAVKQGLYPSLAECAEKWISPLIGSAVQPQADLVALYEDLFPLYQSSRADRAALWQRLAEIRNSAGHAQLLNAEGCDE